MSRSLSFLRVCCGAVTFAMAGVVVCSAQSYGKQRVRPIEFSGVTSDEVTTNLHQLTSRKDSLKQLEEDLYEPLQQHLTPHSSLDGVMAPPPPRAPAPSAVQSKRIKELLERRKNWMLMTPEDLLAAPTVEQILQAPEYSPDGQDKTELRSMDSYLERMAPKHPAKRRRAQAGEDGIFDVAKKPSSPDRAPGREEPDLPPGLKESERALKSFFGTGDSPSPFSEAERSTVAADPFGVGVKLPSQEQALEHKKFMDQYHTLVDPTWHPPAASSLGSPFPALADASQPALKPVPASPGLPSSSSFKALDAQLNVVSPMLGPSGLPDVNAQALGETRPASTIPKVDTRRVIPPPPDFTAPKRVF